MKYKPIDNIDLSTSRMTPKQLEKELCEIASDMLSGPDMFEEHPKLFTESDPVKWAEAVMFDRHGNPLRFWDFQKKYLRSKRKKKASKSGRDTGKTTVQTARGLHYGFTKRDKNILVATPKKAHYAKIVSVIRKQLRFNPSLTNYIEWATDEADQLELRFKHTGSVMYFRQGHPTGEAFRSLDIDMILGDEVAFMSEAAWKALLGCLRADGDELMDLTSSPDGRRNTTFYRLTRGDSGYEVHQWPSWLNPFWTPEKERDLIEFYGGKNTPGWQHEVAGEHGAPAFPAFDTEYLLASFVPVENYALRSVSGEDYTDLVGTLQSEDAIRDRLIEQLDFPELRGAFYLGGDLGYTRDPVDLVLFEETPEGNLVARLHVHCDHVTYPLVEEIIALIYLKYDPVGIGIDRGSNGIAVYQDLTGLDKFTKTGIGQVLHAFDFGSSLVIGYDEKERKEIKQFAKVHATDIINNWLRDHRLRLSETDTDMMDHMVSQTATVTGNRIVYSKGNDHINDAIRCAALAKWKITDSPEIGAVEAVAPCNVQSFKGSY